MEHYTVGLDFGTQSGRAVLVRTRDGVIAAQAEAPYEHGVMYRQLPDGTPLPSDFALQDPLDYQAILYTLIPALLKQSGVDPAAVIGIAIDATASSVFPVDDEFTPLCVQSRFRSQPHAYLKLWKHHSAVAETDLINRVIQEGGYGFIDSYGGRCNVEWLFPKLLETLRQAPEVYHAAHRFVEIGDWLTWCLCGQERPNGCVASYKGFWRKDTGYPDRTFFAKLHPGFSNVLDKLGPQVYPSGAFAGTLTSQAAAKLGLSPATAVCVAHTDAHVAPPAAGITTPGKLLMIIGTSICSMVLDTQERSVPGISGVAADCVVPGLYTYEAGQSAVGDIFQWVVTQLSDGSDPGQLHRLLIEKAARLTPGESGLLMLDWLNGNRSVLSDSQLTGLILGITLQTRPEEIYRAAIEATAFGQRMIQQTLRQYGVPIHGVYACGGIARKNPLLMQIYADVLNTPIHVSAAQQIPAVAAAVYAAVAAGADRGGYDGIHAAAKAMAQPIEHTYTPIPAHAATYDRLYREYAALHQHFGRDDPLMKRLLAIKADAVGQQREMKPWQAMT